MKQRLWLGAGAAILTTWLLVAVFPTRTFFTQRNDLQHEQRRLQVLQEQNQELAAQVKRLHTDSEIERLAREQYNLVRPGEEAYAMLPSPEPTPDAAKAKKKDEKGFWSKVGDTITFWN